MLEEFRRSATDSSACCLAEQLLKAFEARAQQEPNAPVRIGYLPITDAALQAVNQPGTELGGTEVGGSRRGVRGLWVELRHRRRHPGTAAEAPEHDGEDPIPAEELDEAGEG